jgi:hypothetical protein
VQLRGFLVQILELSPGVIGTSSSWYRVLVVVVLEDLGPIGCGERENFMVEVLFVICYLLFELKLPYGICY